jgi:type IV secretory pathway TrbF-like protein
MLASHPETGLQERLGIIDRVAKAGTWWRRATFVCLGLLACQQALRAYEGAGPKERFYTIELDTCSGESRLVGPLPEQRTYRQVNIDYVLERWVMDLRGVSTDAEVTKAQWRRLRDQVTPEGAHLLNQTEAEYQPLTKPGAIVVKIIRVQKREDTRYDVRWQEKHYSKNGELASVSTWGGLFTFRWETPTRAAPLGMLFTLWQVKQEV